MLSMVNPHEHEQNSWNLSQTTPPDHLISYTHWEWMFGRGTTIYARSDLLGAHQNKNWQLLIVLRDKGSHQRNVLSCVWKFKQFPIQTTVLYRPGLDLWQSCYENLQHLNCGLRMVQTIPLPKPFSKVDVCRNYLGILFNCRFWFSNLGVGPEFLHF